MPQNSSFLSCLLLLLFSYTGFSQYTPKIQWTEKYGTAKSDAFHSVLQNKEGILVAVGEMNTKNRAIDMVFAKINPSNGLLLEPLQYLGRNKKDVAYRIIETIEKGYAIVGYSQTSKGTTNACLVRLDGAGTEIGNTLFTATDQDVFYDIVQNSKGNFYVTGKAGTQACLVKYNEVGKELWRKIFDIAGTSVGLSIKLTAQEDLFVAIHQKEGRKHATLVKQLTSDTSIVWKRTLDNIKITDLVIDPEGSIVTTGTLYTPKKDKREDLFLLKFNPVNEQQVFFQEEIRKKGKDGAMALVHSKDGYYYTAGYTYSHKSNINLPRLWVHKMDSTGKAVVPDYIVEGGKLSDEARDIIELEDGSLVVAGQSESSGAIGEKGAWLFKILPEGYKSSSIDPNEEIHSVNNKSIGNQASKITFTWLNNEAIKKEGKIYYVYQPLELKLRAIGTTSALRGVGYAYSVNDTTYQDLVRMKKKSNRTPIGKKSNEEEEFDFEGIYLRLEEGLNTINIKADDKVVKSFTIEYRPSINLHLVSIGIPYADLDYTVKDARDFANLFSEHIRPIPFFNAIDIDTLLTERTTKEGDIRRKINELSKKELRENDYVFLFISSHGFLADESLFIAASDYQGEGVIDAIDFSGILHQLERLNCKKIVFIDACYSGTGVKSSGRINSHAEAMERIAKANNDAYIITSSRSNQASHENKIWENGVFTQALTEAFTNQRVALINNSIQADADNDTYLTLEELFDFLEKRVSFLADTKGEKQTPKSNQTSTKWGSLPIFQFVK